MGLNIEAKAFFSARFDIQAGVTLQRSRYKKPEVWSDNPDVAPVKRMFRTPDAYGYFTANWQICKPLKAIVTGTFTGPMTVQHMEGSGTDIDLAVRTESFFDASAKLVYCFNIFRQVDIDVTAGVSNIFNSYQRDFDSGPRRDSGYIYGPSLPRCLTTGISISI